MENPIIGITLDDGPTGSGYSNFAWYAIRKNYSDSITDGVKQEGLKPLAQAVENKHYPEGHQEAPQQAQEKMPWE